MAVAGDVDVVGLEVTVRNVFAVSGGESMSDLNSVVNRLAVRERSAREHIPEGFAFKQLGDEVVRSVFVADVENRDDVGVTESGDGLRLLLEAAKTLAVTRERLRQDFDGDVAVESRVVRFVDFAHTARADERD